MEKDFSVAALPRNDNGVGAWHLDPFGQAQGKLREKSCFGRSVQRYLGKVVLRIA